MAKRKNKDFETFFAGENDEKVPMIRITRVVLDDFKSVGHGDIKFNCYNKAAATSMDSDILGVYGQNGSGKTALIEALYILKCAMSGDNIPRPYTECIAIDKECARLKFEFALIYDNNTVCEVAYSFCLARRTLTEDELQKIRESNLDAESLEQLEEARAIAIFDEKCSILKATKQNEDSEVSLDKGQIINTRTKSVPLSATCMLGDRPKKDEAVNVLLSVYKDQARNQSRSFIFLQETMQFLFDNCENFSCFQILSELRHFAKWYLCVEDTKRSTSTGIYQIPFRLPIITRRGVIYLPMIELVRTTERMYEAISEMINTLNPILTQLVPGLTLGLKVVSESTNNDGKLIKTIESVVFRDGKEMPLRYESFGVRKLITYIYLYAAAFNGKSITVAIDEFDSGIYEYLLGELVRIMQEYGQGQFIFTSHNLRPLEVLNNKFICFTTANPDNRYVRLKYVRATNNLRDIYFREIMINEQNEPFYKKTSDAKIVVALKKAGENYGE